MRRLVLIANPAASGFTAGLYRDVVRILTGPFDVTPVWPVAAPDARRAAADAVEDGYDVVVAMGGDGVVHQIAGALVGSHTALGIVPAGTANVLGRILGIPAKPRAAAELVAGGEPRPLAVARLQMSGPDGSADDVVTFAAGVGLDASVVERAEREPLRKVWSGSLHYARTTAAVALGTFRSRLPNLRVEAHGRRTDAVTAVVQVHDSWTYLGRIPLGLAPRPGPPGMSVMTVERVTAPRTIGLVARTAARRDPRSGRGIDVWQGVEEVRITADPPSWLQADGELLGRAAEVRVWAGPEPLQVVAP